MRLLTLLIFLISFNAHAIVSMESLHLEESKPGWRGGGDFGLSGAFGNTENFRLKGGAIILNYHNMVTHYLSVNSVYGESSGVEDQNKSFAHLRRIQEVTDRWSWELFGQVENNKFARLNVRALAGTGGRFKVMGDIKNSLFTGLGVFYSLEDIKDLSTDNEGGKHRDLTGNFYVIYNRKLTSASEFVSTTYFQPKLDKLNDARVLENATFKLKLSTAMNFKMSVDVVYDSKPPPSIKKTDINYSTGIEYNF